MRKLLTVIVVLAVSMSLAGEAKSLGAFVSYWNGADIDNGYGLGVKHKFQIIPIFAIDVRASWLSFSDDPVDLNMYPLEATALAQLGLFYGGVGAGYYIFSGNDLDYENAVGGFLLAGVKLSLGGLGVFGELKYTWVEPKVNDVTFDASGVGVNLGVLFGW
jgi:hypothetical protein